MGQAPPRTLPNNVPAPRFKLELLGSFELSGPDGLVNLSKGKLAGLLAYLACTAPKPQAREKLATLLWGSHFDHQAKQNLRQALARLRRVLGDEAFASDGEAIWLSEGCIDCDVARFEALIREGGRDALRAAAEIYRGPLIDDVVVGEDDWTAWLEGERGRLLDLALGALMSLGEQELSGGRAEQALKAGRRAVALNNLREDAHRLILQALVATGRKAEALRHYQDLALLLKRELNAEPDAATRSLVARLRATALSAAHSVDDSVKAGRLAFARWANREAVDFFERALEALASLPESTATLEQGIDIRLELPQALFQVGEVRRALERLREAKQLADRLSDDRRRCRIFSFMAITLALLGEPDEAISAGTRALDLARRLGDLKLIVPASTILQQAHFYRGEHERVADLAAQNLALLPADSATEAFGLAAPPSIYDRGRLIISLAELGRFGEADAFSAQALRLAGGTQRSYTLGWAHLATSWCHVLRGDWQSATPGLEQAMTLLKTDNVVLLRPYAAGLSAWALAELGETEEPLRRLQEGEQLLEGLAASGLTSLMGWYYPWLGRAALRLGRLDDARRLGERGLAVSPRQPGFAAHALQLLGDIAAHPERFDALRGEGRYRQALALAEPLGMRPVMAHCHLGLGRLYRDSGSRKRSGEHLAAAATMYREMGMRFWLDQVEAPIRNAIAHRAPSVASTTVIDVVPSPRALAVAANKPSVAVLPLRNMSGDPTQDYFVDGVSDDIIAALSRFREITVIARGSSFALGDKGLRLREIAEELGVQYVLSGTLRKEGARIRVSAELTHVESDVQIWSNRYDRALANVFDLQDDISRTVAAMVEPAIRIAEIERARRKPPADLSAYDLYLQAMPHLWAGTGRGNATAIELLRQSLGRDAAHAPALAALAWALVMAAPLGAPTAADALAESLDLARRAVELDGADAFAQAVYGFALFGPLGENRQGRIHALEAVRLNPSSAFAWGVLGMIDSMGGEYQHAIECLQRALALSPSDSMLHLWLTGLTAACFALGRHEDGIAWARRSVQHNPGNGMGHRLLAANLVEADHLEEARDVTRVRDLEQKTTIAEIRSRRFFKQQDALERYLSALRKAGVAE